MPATTGNIRIVFNNFPAIATGLRSQAGLAVSKAARDIQGRAQTKAPVDTGALRNSIQAAQVRPFAWRVTVGAEYGIYQEFGTRRMPARPFFFPAVHEVEPSFIAALSNLVTRSAAL
jgi:HK97 gp10 family phage protein